MVFSSVVVVQWADASADAWQRITRVPASERISSRQILDIVICLPLHQMGRIAVCLWTFMCLPTSDSFYSYSYHSSSSDDDDDDHDALDYRDYGAIHGYASSSSSSTVEFDDYYYYSHSD